METIQHHVSPILNSLTLLSNHCGQCSLRIEVTDDVLTNRKDLKGITSLALEKILGSSPITLYHQL